MKRALQACFLALAVIGAIVPVQAQSTAFTYHGRLNNHGTPVTGLHDMQFSVYDADAPGQLIAGPFPLNNVDVVNGLFTARIDFGAGVFTGPARWLEIQVRPAGNGNFQTLTPRQELTSSPYSIRAQTAGTATDVSNGSVVKSLNNLRDNVTLAAGANVTLTPSGNTLTIDSFGGGGGSIWSLNGGNAYYNGGNVGIGELQPQGLLDLKTGVSDTSALFVRADPGTFGRGGIVHHQSATYGWQQLAQTTGSATDGYLTFHYVNRTAPGTKVSSDVLTMRANGKVGIGALFPQSKLHLFEVGDSVTHLIETGGGINAWAKVSFKNLNGQWDIGTSRGFNNDVFYLDRIGTAPLEFQLSTAGALGLGIEPQAKLHLHEPVNSVSQRIETSGAVNAWTRLEFKNGNGQWDIGTSRGFNGDQFYVSRLGSPGIAFGIQPNGDAFLQGTMNCRVLTITGGADIAEPFQMSSDEIPKGSVVVIDEDNPGHLKLSASAYDRRVAGVVSGANGIKPGISLHQEGAIEGGENVALSGRVYVQADATTGAIKPGDLLTSSDTPGHAMKVLNHTRAQGAILGKAMTGLKGGKGMVLVLVTLQ